MQPSPDIVTEAVLCAIAETDPATGQKRDATITRAQWRTAVCYLQRRNADQAQVIIGLQTANADYIKAAKKAKQEELTL